MFGSISTNREHIVVFITMLKSLRFTFDHEELVSVFSSKGTTAISHMRIASLIYLCAACCWLIAQETAMQVFQCHYREGSLMSGLYFDHIKDVLHAASKGTSGFSCKPPPCLNLQNSPGTLFILNLCISDGRPERVKQLSGLLVVQVLIWIWGPRGGKQESDMRAWTHNKHGVTKEAAWLKGALEAGLSKAHWASQRGSNWLSLREVASADITVCYVRGGGGMPAIRFLEVPL